MFLLCTLRVCSCFRAGRPLFTILPDGSEAPGWASSPQGTLGALARLSPGLEREPRPAHRLPQPSPAPRHAPLPRRERAPASRGPAPRREARPHWPRRARAGAVVPREGGARGAVM